MLACRLWLTLRISRAFSAKGGRLERGHFDQPVHVSRFGQQAVGIEVVKRSRDADAGPPERFDEERSGPARRIGHFAHANELGAIGGNMAPHDEAVVARRAAVDRRLAARSNRVDLRVDGEGGRLRPPVDLGGRAFDGRRDREVDQVVVDHDGRQTRGPAAGAAGRSERPGVDDHLPADLPHAGCRDLPRERIQAGERIARREHRVAARVGIGVVGLGVFDLVRFGRSAAQGEIAHRHQNQVAVQNARRIDVSPAEHGRLEAEIAPQCV